ncbi:hypothetical protein ACS0TY_008851 [Phlomoides rotata]
MAANKFATMLHKNSNKITVILVYALLEWILILLLLLNSSFSYLIRKFANFFGLRQSCTWCSTLDHIFDSTNSQLDHVCEAHGAEISKLSYCTDHRSLAESKNLCTHCLPSTLLDCGTINDVSCTAAFFTWMNEGMPGNGEENRCSCCDEILSRKVYPPPLFFKPSWDVHKKALSSQSDLLKHKESGDDDRGLDKEYQLPSDAGEKTEEVLEEFECDDPFLNRSNEDDESVYLTDMLLQNADYTDSDRFICIELIDTPSLSSQKINCSDAGSTGRSTEGDEDDGEAAGVEDPEDFPEGSVQDDCLNEYLSRENLMTRIKGQEEALKAAYEELEEERIAAEEGAKETMAMITKVQEEKAAMQMEAIQYQRMMEEQAEYDQEALQLLNDLMMKRDKEKKELEKELEIYRNKALENEYDDSPFGAHQKHNLDDSWEETGGENENVSLDEFDDERLSILEEVKILEAKLLALHDDETTKISRSGNVLDHETIDVMTKKFDATEFEEYKNHSSGRILIEEGLGHVYERLQVLEEDIDFLKHCIGSMVKGGNKGLILVQEILQHLRHLKSVELSARNSDASAIKEDQV